jgi:predicted transposase YbfD/YdcC
MDECVTPFAEAFGDLPDPRSRQRREHRLVDILFLAFCGTIAGANGPVQIERFGRYHVDWLKKLAGPDSFRRGIPSHDTIGRVFARLDFEKFAKAFVGWTRGMPGLEGIQTIAIDGKRARRSGSSAENRSALHMVSAWSCEAGLCLGQVTTADKSNEITAFPQLLDWLELQGCLVTIDAMGCQRDVAQRITNAGGHYLLGLKGNQGTLHDDAQLLFDWAVQKQRPAMRVQVHEHRTIDGEHGRIEERRYRSIGKSDFNTMDSVQGWAGLESIVRVDSTREVAGHTSSESRYYISSLPAAEIERLAYGVRAHWGVESVPQAHKEKEVRHGLKLCG